MKIIVKVNEGKLHEKFQPFKVVVEVAKGKMREVSVKVGGYSDNRYIEIESGKVDLRPDKLTISVSNVSVPELLLNVELCNFVMSEYPELKKTGFK